MRALLSQDACEVHQGFDRKDRILRDQVLPRASHESGHGLFRVDCQHSRHKVHSIESAQGVRVSSQMPARLEDLLNLQDREPSLFAVPDNTVQSQISKRFQQLATTIINSMWCAEKGDNDITLRCLI